MAPSSEALLPTVAFLPKSHKKQKHVSPNPAFAGPVRLSCCILISNLPDKTSDTSSLVLVRTFPLTSRTNEWYTVKMNDEYSLTSIISSKFHKSLISRLNEINVDYYDFYEGEGVFYKPSEVWTSIGAPIAIANYGRIYKHLDCICMNNGREDMIKSCDFFYFKIKCTRESIADMPEALDAQIEQQYVPSLLSKFDTLQDKMLFLNNLQVEMHRLLDSSNSYDIFIRFLISTMSKKEFYDFMDKYNRKYSGIFYD